MANANLNSCPAHPARHVTIQQSLRYQRFSCAHRNSPRFTPGSSSQADGLSSQALKQASA